MVTLSLGALHRHAEPSGRAAAGGGIAAVGQVRHAGGTGVLRAVTCKGRAVTNHVLPPSWQLS